MSFLSDVEIKKAIGSKDIEIEPFDEKNLEPSSYDFKIGRALIAGKGIAEQKDFPLYLKPGDWMEIESLEIVKISQKIGVIMGMPSGMSRKGILAFSGMHIDPGYRGRIFITLFNPSSDTYKIEHGQKLSSALFFNFEELPSRSYDGQHQEQYHFPEKDVEWMIRLKAPTIADAIKSVEELEKMIIDVRSDLGGAKGEITEIRNDIKIFKIDIGWIKNLLIAILIALVIGIAVVIGQKFI
jgi:dCTP deaminase